MDAYAGGHPVSKPTEFLQKTVELPVRCELQDEVEAFVVVEDIVHG